MSTTQRVDPAIDYTTIKTCQQAIISNNKIADLDGRAFDTYYHNHPSCLPKGAKVPDENPPIAS